MRKHKCIKDISMGETTVKVADRSMSLRDKYAAARRADELRSRPHRELLERVSLAAMCSPETARQWALGLARPGKLARQALAAEFGVAWETLFPEIAGEERERAGRGTEEDITNQDKKEDEL